MAVRVPHHKSARARASSTASTRWLVITRAGVLPLTLFSGLIALLLAAVAERPAGSYAAIHGIDWLGLTLAIVGILVAHVGEQHDE